MAAELSLLCLGGRGFCVELFKFPVFREEKHLVQPDFQRAFGETLYRAQLENWSRNGVS